MPVVTDDTSYTILTFSNINSFIVINPIIENPIIII